MSEVVAIVHAEVCKVFHHDDIVFVRKFTDIDYKQLSVSKYALCREPNTL